MESIKKSMKGSKVIVVNYNWQDLNNVICEHAKVEMELLNKK